MCGAGAWYLLLSCCRRGCCFVLFFVWSIESLPLCCEDDGAQPFCAEFFGQLFGQRRLHDVEVLVVVAVVCYMHM